MATVVPIDNYGRTRAAHPFDHVLAALRQHGCRVRLRNSNSARSSCPVHHDRNPSLVVTWKDNKVVMRCFAGCKNREIVAAIGLRMADLFSGPPIAPRPRQIVAVYSYSDLDGVIDAEKVRTEPKAFRWRVPAPATRDGYRWGLHGVIVGLYRLPELVAQARIIVTEGEKAADRLAVLDLVTSCPPNGASSWDDAWSADLWALGCRELIVLANNDSAGRAHAERVGRSWLALEGRSPSKRAFLATVKIICLPGPIGADVVDWLETGQDVETLLALIANAANWTSETADAQRLERRRAFTRERVRRHRANHRVTPRTSESKAVTVTHVTRPNVPLDTLRMTAGTSQEIEDEKAS